MKYDETPRTLDKRDIITPEAHAVFWTKDGAWHVARPDPSRGQGMFWTYEAYSTREEAAEALGDP